MANPAVEAAIQGLEASGITMPPSMEGLIEMLLNEGEDVLTAIPHVISVIEQMGGNVWQTLDEVAIGMQQYGPASYVQRQIDLAFDPHINRIQEIHQSKQTMLALHRDALTNLKTQVHTLAPGGSSTQSYTGTSADAMLLSFDALSSSMSTHLDLLEQSLEIDRHFLTNIQTAKTVNVGAAIIALLLIAVVLVIALALAIPSGGISLAVGGGIVIALSAGDVALLLGSIIAAFAAWGIGHQLLNHPIQWNWGTSPTTPTTPSKSTGLNSGKLFSTMKTTPDGRRIRVRKLSQGEVKKLRTESGEPFEEAKQGGLFKSTNDIYVDQDGEYWIGNRQSDNVEGFP